MRRLILLPIAVATATLAAQAPQPDWSAIEAETLTHFQALVKINTTDPPGGERPAVEYLKQVLEREGIPTQAFALEDHRPNLVARLKGNGRKRPVLIMGHTDTVNVDEKKWTFPPFSAARDSGYIYGRGTIDDKDNVTGALMTLLTLKRLKVPLDRDVIFLAEAGEEGASRLGVQFMAEQHFADIDAEYCFAEGGKRHARERRAEVRRDSDAREDSRDPSSSSRTDPRATPRSRSRATPWPISPPPSGRRRRGSRPSG